MFTPRFFLLGFVGLSALVRAGEQDAPAIAIKKAPTTEVSKTNGPALRITGAGGRDHTHSKETATKEALLTSVAGQWFVGHQLRFFNKEKDGSLSVTKPSWINLYYTEGRSFKLTGQVMLAEEAFNEDQPQGFALYLREFGSLYRYEMTCFGMRVKRRLVEGNMPEEFVFPFKFEGLAPGMWHEFSVEVSQGSISFNMGDQSGKVNGPLDTDGANKIVLAPGAKLRDLRLTLSD